MARRSRDITPPLEVLGTRLRSRGDASAADRSLAETSPLAQWLEQARQPIVVRIPRGYAVLIGAAMLSLIVLAYWVGYARNLRRAASPGSALTPSTSRSSSTTRQLGASYWVLTVFPYNPQNPNEHRAAADRCRQFLLSHGVETIIKPDDNGAVKLIDLKGFKDNEHGTEPYYQYMERLRQLGRSWKVMHQGHDAFTMMRVEKYTGR